MNDQDYGQIISASFAYYDPDSSSWKTSQACLVPGLDEFSETWPKAGMMRNGRALALRNRAYPTSGKGYSWLPTPQASDGIFLSIIRPVYLNVGAYGILSNRGGGRWKRKACGHSLESVGWVVEPDLRGGNDGIPSKLDKSRIRALGNAVVPALAQSIGEMILKAWKEMEA